MKLKIQFVITLTLVLILSQSLKAQETIIEQDWVKTYSSQDSIYNQATAIDVNGNVYVTGFTYNSVTQADITTIKYSDTGTELWVQTFNGTGNKNDRATGISFDSNGNIYVCGFTTNTNNNTDFVLIKYNDNGVQQWIKTYDNNGNDKANSIVIDNSNNIYLTGFSQDVDSDFLTIKYDQSGNQIWNNRKNFGINDQAQSIEIYNNNLYISGTAENADNDYAIISYSLNGAELWSSSVTSAIGIDDFAKDITVNSNGVFVTGYSQNTNIYQYFTINYSLTGVLNWRKQYKSSGDWNLANSICSDNLGNIYIVGSTRNPNTSTITTIKYDQNGNEQWLQNYYMSGNIEKYQPRIICDNDSGIYIAGTVNNINADFCTIKYDYNGNELWAQTYNGNNNGSDVAADLTVDANDNIYVTGQSYNGNNYDFCTIKYIKRDIYIPEDNQLDPPSNNYVFYQNKGQIRDVNLNLRPDLEFYTTTVAPQIYISKDSLFYVFSHIDEDSTTIDTICRVSMELSRSNNTELSYFEPIGAKLNYYLGFIPEGRTNINGYKRIVKPNVYDKIDLHYYSNYSGFKYYFVVNPNGNKNNIRMKFTGAENVEITQSGKLSIETQIGIKSFEKAVVYRITPNGNKIPMLSSGAYYFDNDGNVKINVDPYPSNNRLVIAVYEGYSISNAQNLENINWSTYYGGSNPDNFLNIKTNITNNVWVTGTTMSNNFPISNCTQYPDSLGQRDVVVINFTNEGVRLWATYYGSSGNECYNENYDLKMGLDVDDNGNCYISGASDNNIGNADLPVLRDFTYPTAYQDSVNACTDIFIAQFNNLGALEWSTYYGEGTS